MFITDSRGRRSCFLLLVKIKLSSKHVSEDSDSEVVMPRARSKKKGRQSYQTVISQFLAEIKLQLDQLKELKELKPLNNEIGEFTFEISKLKQELITVNSE